MILAQTPPPKHADVILEPRGGRTRSLDPFINENDCYIHAGALKMTAPIL